MSLYRKSLLALAATALICSAAQAQTPAPAPAAQESASAVNEDPSKVLATVNGVKITQGEVDQASAELDPQFARLPVEQRRLAALAALIDIKAMATEAEKDGLDQTEEFKQRFAFLKDRALHNEYFKAAIIDKVNDDEVRARYEKEIAAIEPETEVRARHILVKTKEEAEELIKKLDGGAKFEDLAKENSTDGSAANGGDLGYFTTGQMVPEFEKAAFALNNGEYTKEPVQSQFGFHVIQVEDKRPQPAPTLEQVKDQIRSILLRERYVEAVNELRKKLDITYDDADVEKAMKAATEEQEKALEEAKKN